MQLKKNQKSNSFQIRLPLQYFWQIYSLIEILSME